MPTHLLDAVERRGQVLLVDQPILRRRLLDCVAADFRVIAPRCDERPGAMDVPMLLGFMECLGLVRPTVVAAESALHAVLELAITDPARLGYVLLLCDDADRRMGVQPVHPPR